MREFLALCLGLWALLDSSNGDTVSSKMDFGEEPPLHFSEEPTYIPSNNNKKKVEDEDVDVQHTIVISSRVNKNNNNRRAITYNGNDGALTFTINETPQDKQKEDSGEIPVIKGYKSVETTELKTPDTRYKTKIYPDSVFVNRNIRDEADIFPNVIAYPMNWKPASFYNNVNYNRDEYSGRDPYSVSRRRYPNRGTFHRKITEDGMKDFYCKKCAELSIGQGVQGCSSGVQQRSASSVKSWYETTTAKMKIDGKLAKLN